VRRVSAGRTDTGRVRKKNEDAFLADDGLGLYIVADGMGGHAAGEVASNEAIDTIRGMICHGRAIVARYALEPDSNTAAAVRRLIESAVQAATYMVHGLAAQSPDRTGMGTTTSLLLVAGADGWIGQVGDSRVYLVRKGLATQVTQDHTWIASQVRQGLMTEEEAANSPHRSAITRAVGNRDYVEVDTFAVAIEDGDRFVLCSDGLHGYVDSAELPAMVLPAPSVAARDLVRLANDRGGEDNITAVVVALGDRA